jgi:hypothetical protein
MPANPAPGVIDNLTSTSTTDALSANQGRVLNNRIKRTARDYTVSTNDELKAALVDMITKCPSYGIQYYTLTTVPSGSTVSLIQKTIYACLAQRAASGAYGNVLLTNYSRQTTPTIYQFSYNNGTEGYSMIQQFSGTNVATW